MTVAEFLRRHDARLAAAFEGLFGSQSPRVALDPVDRELILVGLCAVYGTEVDVEEHGRMALEAGAAPAAAIEAILTAAISRGPRALMTSRGFLLTLPDGTRPLGGRAGATPPVPYFESEFGAMPEWAQRLAEFSLGSLECYATLREALLVDGAARRKTKELLTMALNAVDNSAGGVRTHAAAALRHGARREEVLDGLLQAVRVGGIIAWINGVASLANLFD